MEGKSQGLLKVGVFAVALVLAAVAFQRSGAASRARHRAHHEVRHTVTTPALAAQAPAPRDVPARATIVLVPVGGANQQALRAAAGQLHAALDVEVDVAEGMPLVRDAWDPKRRLVRLDPALAELAATNPDAPHVGPVLVAGLVEAPLDPGTGHLVRLFADGPVELGGDYPIVSTAALSPVTTVHGAAQLQKLLLHLVAVRFGAADPNVAATPLAHLTPYSVAKLDAASEAVTAETIRAALHPVAVPAPPTPGQLGQPYGYSPPTQQQMQRELQDNLRRAMAHTQPHVPA